MNLLCRTNERRTLQPLSLGLGKLEGEGRGENWAHMCNPSTLDKPSPTCLRTAGYHVQLSELERFKLSSSGVKASDFGCSAGFFFGCVILTGTNIYTKPSSDYTKHNGLLYRCDTADGHFTVGPRFWSGGTVLRLNSVTLIRNAVCDMK